jgi:phosphomannomutase
MTNKTLLLFDVDNTISISRGSISQEMADMLKTLSKEYDLATVSGSDLPKMMEQLGDTAMYFKWLFTENGLVTYFDHQIDSPYNKTSLINEIGQDYYNEFVNSVLEELSKINIPIKRSNFIELRNGLVNICPIGRDCTQQEREDFEKYDKIHLIRQNLCDKLRIKYGDKLTFSIGGQISIDVFPVGWNKTFCLQFIQSKYDNIYFFGDKTMPGGNDYEISVDSRITMSYSVVSWRNTYEILKLILNKTI